MKVQIMLATKIDTRAQVWQSCKLERDHGASAHRAWCHYMSGVERLITIKLSRVEPSVLDRVFVVELGYPIWALLVLKFWYACVYF
jgi:hypothetical protein